MSHSSLFGTGRTSGILSTLCAAVIGAFVLTSCTQDRQLGVPSAPEDPGRALGPAAENDLTGSGDDVVIGTGYFISADPQGNEGTGNVNPFLTVQNTGTEEGANTMGDTDGWPDLVTGGDRTDELRLDEVPTLPCPDDLGGSDFLCREFSLDIHESQGTGDVKFISVDEIQIYLADDPNADAADLDPDAATLTFDAAVLVYNLDAAGDEWIKLDTENQPGSGQGDMRMLIRDDEFGGGDDCAYDAGAGTDCDLWVIMYTFMGTHFASEATFEEWGVRILPFVNIEKTAETSVTRQAQWEITKEVDPDQWDLFTGDDGTSEYTITVERLEGEEVDIAWSVEGTIILSNTSGSPAKVISIEDEMEGIGPVAVTCPSPVPFVIANNDEVVCTYCPVDLPDGTERDNTVTVQVAEDATDDPPVPGITTQGGVTFDFTDPDNIEIIDGEVHVDDTNDDGDASGITDDTTYTYTRTFTCDEDEGTHDNTADLLNEAEELLDSDSASVLVNCYALTVEKDAATELTRTWEWTIDKTGAQGELTLAVGQAFLGFTYTVTVDTSGSSDSDWKVSGNITVDNPNPVLDAVVNDVSDLVSPDIAASVECPGDAPYTIVAGGSLACTYEADLPDASDRTNTATATLQNHSYDEDLVATETGTTDFDSDAVDVSFADPTINEVDECIDVTDDFGTPGDTGDDQDLGQVCITDALPADLTYDRDFGPFTAEDCGEITITNRATFVTNDTEATDFDEFTLVITVTCPVSCTLTPGYWKTHNDTFHGGAPPDDTWDELPSAEGTIFYLSGQTWFEVFWTPPQGNAYYNLAHHYMAAVLNVLNDADGSLIADELGDADLFFSDCTPADVAGAKGNQPIACSQDGLSRNDVIALAGVLASFNEGTLPGTEHCDEDENSVD